MDAPLQGHDGGLVDRKSSIGSLLFVVQAPLRLCGPWPCLTPFGLKLELDHQFQCELVGIKACGVLNAEFILPIVNINACAELAII